MDFTDGLYTLAAYMLALSVAGFLSVLWDREAMGRQKMRIPINVLLAVALIGGSAGVVAGRNLLGHKSQPHAFTTYLRMIVIVQFTVLLMLAIPTTRQWFADLFFVA